MLLVIDAGNTNTSLGVFDGAELVAHWRLTTARSRTVDEYGVHARNLFELAGLDFKTINAIAITIGTSPVPFLGVLLWSCDLPPAPPRRVRSR